MTRFNFHNYEHMPEGKILRIKLNVSDDLLHVINVSRSVLQSYQPGFTPITKINLTVIKDLDIYKTDKDDYENLYELKAEPEEIELYELIDL